MQEAGDHADDEGVEGADADQGEDGSGGAGVGVEDEAADEVEEDRCCDRGGRDHEVAPLGSEGGGRLTEDGDGEVAAERAEDGEVEGRRAGRVS